MQFSQLSTNICQGQTEALKQSRAVTNGRAFFNERVDAMANSAGKGRGAKATAEQAAADYTKGLSPEYRMLVVLKSQLYGGHWEPMLDDLRNRLAGKPYIFKLANRIQDDIERIEEMRKFEAEHRIDLADYVDSP